MLFIFLPILAVILALLHIILSKKQHNTYGVFKTLLVYLLASAGIGGLIGFTGHVFFAAETARSIGWPVGSPFQFEVGIANLGIGVLGILCIWIKDKFWLATIIMTTVFGWGAAAGHIHQIIQFHNYSINNAGPILYTDISLPLLYIILFIGYKISKQEEF